jgi:IS5 family transposase
VLNFRHWLEQHDLTKVLFDEVGAMLEERGLLMRQGTIPAFARTDATIIAAPPSTKNKSKAHDPEMHQTKKGNQWHFGMKAHIGVDVASGVVHTLTGTAANEADINQMAAVLHGREEAVFADAGYTGADKRPEHEDREVSWNIAIKRGIIKACPGEGRGRCQRYCATWRSRWSGRCRSCARRSSIPSMSSKTCSATRSYATAVWPRTPRSAHPVRLGQLGDRQESAARAEPCLIMLGGCLDPESNIGKPTTAPVSANTDRYQPHWL